MFGKNAEGFFSGMGVWIAMQDYKSTYCQDVPESKQNNGHGLGSPMGWIGLGKQ